MINSSRPIAPATRDRASALADEVAKRRTFAIISHPDAGKTTLTEKLLLYGGAVQPGRLGHAPARRSATPPRTGWRSSASAASRSPRPCSRSRTAAARSTCSTPPATRTSPRTPTAR